MIYTEHDYLIRDDCSVYPSLTLPPNASCKERYRIARIKVKSYIKMYMLYHLIFRIPVNDISDGSGLAPDGFFAGEII